MKRLSIIAMGVLLQISAFAFGSAAYADVWPDHVVFQAEIDDPSCVHAADLDDDGDLDVLSASSGDGKIAWYANDGTGQFGSQQVIATSTGGATYVHAADLDGDGDLDVLSLFDWDGKIVWYENDGTGQFGLPQVIIDGMAYCASIADLDNDGDLDVLSASYRDRIDWCANEGTGRFGPPQVITAEARDADLVYAGDLDGDGDLDVLTMSDWYGEITWYANDGTGRFGTPQVITTEVDQPYSVHVADLDNDGDLDVLWVSVGDDKIAWYENDGTGQFGSLQVVTTEADRADSVYTTDLDGDGDLDVLSTSRWGYGKIAWYENDGSGLFGPQQVITASGAGAVHAADLDNDGDQDVLSASASADRIAWYENNGSGQFGLQRQITLSFGVWAFHTADLDDDGDQEVLSAAPYAGVIAWYANDGTGRFGTQQVITAEAAGAVSVYAADLDGDGDLDVLSAGAVGGWFEFPGSGEIAWYENDGSGRFGSPQVISTVLDGGSYYVRAADLDGDGDLDALSASRADGQIIWYENDGTGRFISQRVVSALGGGGLSVYTVCVADPDNDGDLDVLATLGGDNKVVWYENDGTGQFTSPQVISAVDAPQSVYAADLDKDGDLDVLSASHHNGIAWYENDGTGQFGTPQVIPTEVGNTNIVYAADLDNDGDLDVIAVSDWGDRIDWYENDGTGRFGTPQPITTTAASRWFASTIDMDGDGDLDVLSMVSGEIAWYENETANKAPVADAGLSRYVATDPIQLDGTHSYDPDESAPLTYKWTQISGPPLIITGADTATPTINGFVQTDEIQKCEFELVVGDSELTSLPDSVMIIIVPNFGPSTLRLENTSFDKDKPTVIYFGGGNCMNGNPGQPWNGGSAWTDNANVIGFPSGYTRDSGSTAQTYYRYGDMIIAYLSEVAPDYRQPIQTIGWSTGGMPAMDVGIHMNRVYRDARYAVNHVTHLEAPCLFLNHSWDVHLQAIDLFLTSSVDGEQCWLDEYYGTQSSKPEYQEYLPYRTGDFLLGYLELAHSQIRDWYRNSLTGSDMNKFNSGVVAGAYWSVVGPGKNLHFARSDAYYFEWDGGVQSGSMDFYDEAQYPGRLPEPVTLVGPEDGAFVDANGVVLSCEPSENAVGYQLLFGSEPYRVMDYRIVSDTPEPPAEVITTFPFEQTFWTVKAYDPYGSTIYADPICVYPEMVEDSSQAWMPEDDIDANE